MAEIYEYWIGQAGFDGFRIDTVKHVDMGFWQTWCPAVHAWAATNGRPNFFMFGEVYDGSDAKCGSYTGTQGGGPFKLESVLDYPLYFLVKSVFATATGNTAQIEKRYAAMAANYDPSAQNRLVTFLDNHDQARFLSAGNAKTIPTGSRSPWPSSTPRAASRACTMAPSRLLTAAMIQTTGKTCSPGNTSRAPPGWTIST